MGARLGIKKPLVPGGSRGARAGTGLVSSLRASQVRECGSASRLHPHPQADLSSNYHACCLTIRDSCPDNLSTQAKINTKIIQNGPLLRLAAHHCCLSVGEWERGEDPAGHLLRTTRSAERPGGSHPAPAPRSQAAPVAQLPARLRVLLPGYRGTFSLRGKKTRVARAKAPRTEKVPRCG